MAEEQRSLTSSSGRAGLKTIWLKVTGAPYLLMAIITLGISIGMHGMVREHTSTQMGVGLKGNGYQIRSMERASMWAKTDRKSAGSGKTAPSNKELDRDNEEEGDKAGMETGYDFLMVWERNAISISYNKF